MRSVRCLGRNLQRNNSADLAKIIIVGFDKSITTWIVKINQTAFLKNGKKERIDAKQNLVDQTSE